MSSIVDRVEELADFFRDQAEEADQLGRLPDTTAKMMREVGVMKTLQPAEFGGAEGSPVDFFKSVLSVGSRSASAGWVISVVGVHAFEIAQADRRLQEEIWGDDPDTWVASPYAPFGKAKRVDGGYSFSGRWPFSSGTDHCEWAILGGVLQDDVPAGANPVRHFVIPRKDYQIQHDSWNVVGLKGSGSKDLVIEDAFVPDYRVIDPDELGAFTLAERAGRQDSPTYRMPFHTMFGGTIACGTLAAALGVALECTTYMRNRVTLKGVATKQDPRHLYVLGEALADIDASRLQFLSGVEEMWELAQHDEAIPLSLRARARRDQVRSVHRAIAAADELVKIAGGNSLRMDSPIQRPWRDAHMGQGHQANVADPLYQAFGLDFMGLPLPPNARL